MVIEKGVFSVFLTKRANKFLLSLFSWRKKSDRGNRPGALMRFLDEWKRIEFADAQQELARKVTGF